ncbi:MAG: hypothetical protein JJU34_06295 [Lunatimonas sp.]|uniref:glycosyltransferase n=1 Tax=Lunatimonas sp. TaxID=2060141 RepID=UPI00263B789C|nr:glycosyltransferase [Lunatimonas sp.]MCC5936873.1 hypothetical protein [Lunatimonas sp.]
MKIIDKEGFRLVLRQEAFQFEEISKKMHHPKELKEIVEGTFRSKNFFGEAIRIYNPKLVILDASFIYYSVHLLESKIPIITVSTKVCQNKAPGIPPFQSSYIPGKIPLFTNLLVEGLWIIHLIKKKWKDHRDNVSPERLSWYHMARRYMKQLNRHPKFVTKRSSHFGWKDIPELILSPRHFDFPRPFPSNQIHIGPVVDTERREDQSEIDKVSEVLSTEGIKVYCAMGSYDTEFRNDRIKFFVSLINIFLLRRNWQLILSTGRDIDPSGFRPVPDNVHLFQSVPQLHLIKNVDLMINHGGMQSITECILLETPMLVFPLNPNLDQPGNAARVVYHRLGMRGKLKKDTAKQIENKVDELLTNRSFYVKNIQRLKQQMLDSGDFERGIAFIESYIKSQEVIHEA